MSTSIAERRSQRRNQILAAAWDVAAVLSVASSDDVGVVVGGDVLRAESGPADR